MRDLTSATLNPIFPHHVIKYGLLNKDRAELIFGFTEEGVYIARTYTCDDPNFKRKIDEERPFKEFKSSISPRLSLVMLNFLNLFDIAKELCKEVHSKLIDKDYLYRSVSIYLVDRAIGIHNRSKTFEVPTNSLETFKETVNELLEKFLLESDIEIRRIGVKLSNLTKKEEKQKQITSFFDNTKK